MRTITVQTENPLELRLYLAEKYPCIPPAILRRALKNKDVKRNGVRLRAEDPVADGEQLDVYIDEKYFSFPVLWENDAVLCIEKPQGVPCETVQSLYFPYALCHRLDTMTGGILMLAKSEEALAEMENLFKERSLTKLYQGIVSGNPEPSADLHAFLKKDAKKSTVSVSAHSQPGALPIHTGYRLVRKQGPFSLLEIHLYTGRTHQIRAHLASVGLPIVGDEKYGDFSINRQVNVHRQQLWAVSLRFPKLTGPLSGLSEVEIRSIPHFSISI